MDTFQPAYVLQNKVTHARFLPKESAHAFNYPTLAILVSLNALEAHKLDIWNGWLFGYGGISGRITGLRPLGYFGAAPKDAEKSIRQKLEACLADHGFDSSELEDSWILTMPSFLGFEGINPLTVHFCYKTGSIFWLVVLEVHNTFGERHAYVLEVGVNENQPSSGYTHSWTFHREFHVSPFNDRSGTYNCSIVAPAYSPTQADKGLPPPKPTIRINMYTEETPSRLKLTAVLRPVISEPWSSSALIKQLAAFPLGLLLSFPRIVYHAYILHYIKRLDVFIRPEPRAVDPVVESSLGKLRNSTYEEGHAGGVHWLPEGFVNGVIRRAFEKFMEKRAKETGIDISVHSTDPAVDPKWFTSDVKSSGSRKLSITYRNQDFFSIMLTSPSVDYALLTGQDTEHMFQTSDKSLFLEVFDWSPRRSSQTLYERSAYFLRRQIISKHLPSSSSNHPLDSSFSHSLVPVLLLTAIYVLSTLEKAIFMVTKARFVRGDEPWGIWDRVGKSFDPIDKLGSVRRE